MRTAVVVLMMLAASPAWAQSDDDARRRVDLAEACSAIADNLARLACFDEVFPPTDGTGGTPAADVMPSN